MILSYKHKGLEVLAATGKVTGIQPVHRKRINKILTLLNGAVVPEDLNLPGLDFHGLKGDKSGAYSVSVSGNWRITYEWENGNAVRVDYVDYH